MKTTTNEAPLPARRLTVCNKGYERRKRYNPSAIFPIISLTGKWLQQSGFRGGQILKVHCENRRLVITVEEDPE